MLYRFRPIVMLLIASSLLGSQFWILFDIYSAQAPPVFLKDRQAYHNTESRAAAVRGVIRIPTISYPLDAVQNFSYI